MHNMNKLRKINNIKSNDNKEVSAFENNCEIDVAPNSTKMPNHILLAGPQAYSLYKNMLRYFRGPPAFVDTVGPCRQCILAKAPLTRFIIMSRIMYYKLRNKHG